VDVSSGTDRTVRRAAPELELDGVTKSFGEVRALDAAHFRLRPGTVHALLGENGAGKTSLMRIVYGLLKADAGELRIDGTATALHSPADAIARGIGMVQQHFSLVPALTAVENFALGGHGRFDRAYEAERLEKHAAELGLRIARDEKADVMSAAEQQQLEIAKALRHDCGILILDEPTAVLTPQHAESLLKWLRSFANQGASAVLITHKLRDAVAVADDVTVLRQGRTVLERRIADVTEQELLAAMLGTSGAELDQERAPSNSAGDIVASVNNVSSKETGRREQLSRLSLDVRAGEIVGVAGLDGSGHRLLLRILAGRRAPSAGSAKLPARVAFIPEDRQREALASQLDLRENVMLRGAGVRRGWLKWSYWTEYTSRLLREFNVRAQSERATAQTLSGGNQQKLVLARELADGPQLIVAENPLRGLDVQAATEIRARLRAACDRGAAVVFYSSDLDELIADADRIVVIYDGHVRHVASTREEIGRALVGAV
jgi:simple sugar transport system ATP-binding protein